MGLFISENDAYDINGNLKEGCIRIKTRRNGIRYINLKLKGKKLKHKAKERKTVIIQRYKINITDFIIDFS